MDIVEGLRKVIEELLVSELRGIKEEVKGLSLRMDQMEKRFE